MSHYFYTDPLAAAWMAKHFGMKFGFMVGGKPVERPVYHPGSDEPRPFEDVNDILEVEAPLYVHPDSLHLLQPQVGDVVQNPDDDVTIVVADKAKRLTPGSIRLSTAKEFVGEAATIIQRNGKAFHWPESDQL